MSDQIRCHGPFELYLWLLTGLETTVASGPWAAPALGGLLA